MYKDFKHIKNVSEDKKSAVMLLNKRIGNAYDDNGNVTEFGIRGDIFANEMLYLKAVEKVDNILVDINCKGGNVTQDGYAIMNAIRMHEANTIGTGLVCSMAVGCLLAGKQADVLDYASLMTHAVSGDEDDKILNIVQDSLKTLYKGRTNLNGDTLDNMFKQETWFSNSKSADYTLEDAKKFGMIDNIINTGKKIKGLQNAKKDIGALENIYNTLTITKTDNMIELKKVLDLKNDLSDDKAENIAVETIKTLKAENASQKTNLTTALNKVTELQGKIDEIENAAKVEKTRVATESVDAAIKAGKIKAENKAAMIIMAETDLNAFNILVGASNTTKAAIIFEKSSAGKADNSRDNWTFKDWIMNDAKGLDKMVKNDPEFVNKLPK